ncbi:MAG: methyltransferase domain-containing protein, partial [Candidatus Margulisbacteria bacterium]|nr:methyltransferase domain-containing protein [Candidatus Margulisiibacteriota bacterium]
SKLSLNYHRRINDRIYSSIFERIGKNAFIVSIGGGGRREHPDFVNLDIALFPEVDIVGNAHALPFINESLDAVIINAVLEHVEDPFLVVEKIERVLKIGGFIYAEVPFIQPFHPYPNDYFRFTIEGLKKLLSHFKEIECGTVIGPISAMLNLFQAQILTLFRNRFLRILAFGFTLVLLPLKYVDKIIGFKGQKSITCASAFYFFGKK